MSTKETILEILKELHPEVDNFEEMTDMVHSGTLNSLDIVTLITELSDKFEIDIPPQEIAYENFDSVDGLTKMVERLENE